MCDKSDARSIYLVLGLDFHEGKSKSLSIGVLLFCIVAIWGVAHRVPFISFFGLWFWWTRMDLINVAL